MMDVTKQVCLTQATLLTAQKSKHAMIPIQLTGILCSAPDTFPGLAKKMQTDLKVMGWVQRDGMRQGGIERGGMR
jgi:hypothetical protein